MNCVGLASAVWRSIDHQTSAFKFCMTWVCLEVPSEIITIVDSAVVQAGKASSSACLAGGNFEHTKHYS